jgi:hypothetical protein
MRIKMYSFVNSELTSTHYDILWIKNAIAENNDALAVIPDDPEMLIADDDTYLTLLDKFMDMISQTYRNSDPYFDDDRSLSGLLAKIRGIKKELEDVALFRSKFFLFQTNVDTTLEEKLANVMGGLDELLKLEKLVQNRVHLEKLTHLKEHNAELELDKQERLEYLDIVKQILL